MNVIEELFLPNICTEYFYRIFLPNISAIWVKKNYNDELFGICVTIGNYRHIYFKECIYNWVINPTAKRVEKN